MGTKKKETGRTVQFFKERKGDHCREANVSWAMDQALIPKAEQVDCKDRGKGL